MADSAHDFDAASTVIQALGNEGYSGVIRMDVSGQPVIETCFGLSDRDNQLLNTHDTRFGVASATKMFTSLRVLQLADQGQIDLKRPINGYLNELPDSLEPEVSTYDLLTHTSGLGDYLDEESELPFERMPVERLMSPGDFMPWVRDVPSNPGGRGRPCYSSAGYILLGLLIERVTNDAYVNQIETHVFAPTGMSRSGFFHTADLPEDCALGYMEDGHANTRHIPARGGPDGGAYCTADDLSRFLDKLHAGGLLSPVCQALLYQIPCETGSTERYACGQVHLHLDGITWVGHTGSDPGASAMVFRDLKNARNLICLANDASWAFKAFRLIRQVLIRPNPR